MGKNKSASNLVNVIDFNNDRIAFISGSTTLMSISSSGAITTTGVISGSNAASASYALNAGLLNNKDSAEFVATGSFNTFSSSILTYTGSADSRLGSIETVTGSNITRLSALESASGSAITRLSALETTSGSNITRLNSIETVTGSNITRLNSIESKTGSYATTGSNIFDGGQYLSSSFNPTGFSTTASLYTDGGLRVTRDAYISGTLYLNNVTVFGTQSVAYISSSQLNIGTNLITVNTDTPSIRFGGLAVYDSGSTGLTGSLLWDSQNNHWIYSNPSGSSYSGGMFISGPRTSTLGSETGTTSCMLMAGQGGDHITSSMIYHSSTVTCFHGNSYISASGAACFANDTTIGGNLYVGNTSTTSSITLTGASVGGFTAGYMYWGNGNQTTAGLHFNSPGTNVEITTGFNERVALSTGTGLQVYTNNGVGAYTSRMLLDRSGNVCFSGNACALSLTTSCDVIVGNNINLSNDRGIFIKRADGTSGQAVFLGSGNELNIGFGVADVIRFATYLNNERLRITSAGIACFSCQVCTAGLQSSDSLVIRKDASVDNRYIQLCNTQTGGYRWDLVVRSTAQGCGFGILNNTTSQYALLFDVNNIASFGGTICAGGAVDGTIFNSTSNAFRFSGNNALSLVSLNAQNVVKINAAGYWGTQLVGANDQGILINNIGSVGIGTTQSGGCLTRQFEVYTSSGATNGNTYIRFGNGTGGAYGGNIHLEFAYNDHGNVNAFSVPAKIQAAIDPDGLGYGTGNLLFYTKGTAGNCAAIERMRITSTGISCFACTICSGGSIARKGYDFHTNGQWYKIPFYLEKGNGVGNADTRCIVVINNNDSFQELHFTIEYGSRLQGVSDQATQTSLRSYGVNRFNSGTITVNDTYLITGGSGCAINTHAPVTVAPVGSCMSVVKVDFSTSLGNSSFVWGEVRIWSIESLTGKISIPNNNY
jgi:hypothetical protein